MKLDVEKIKKRCRKQKKAQKNASGTDGKRGAYKIQNMFYWNWNFLPRLNHSPKKISTLLRGFCGFIAIELVCKLVRKKKTGSYFFIILVTLLSIKGEAIRDIDTIILILKLSVSGLVQKKKGKWNNLFENIKTLETLFFRLVSTKKKTYSATFVVVTVAAEVCKLEKKIHKRQNSE